MKLYALLFLFCILCGTASAAPVLTYHPPTENNDTTIHLNHTQVNVTINTSTLDEFHFDLDYTELYDSNCVLDLKFNTASDFYDYSGTGNNGTNNGSTFTVDGKKLGAREFDGLNDYVDCGNDASLNISTNDFTFEGWVYPLTYTTPGIYRGIVGGEGGAMGGGLNGVNGYLRLTKVDIVDAPSSNTQVPLNKWSHIAAVFDSHSASNNLKYFVDGVCVATVTFDVDFTELTNVIGARKTTSQYFNGSIDEVRIYNTSLSAEQILQRYKSTRSKYYDDDLVLALGLNNLSALNENGSKFTDISEYGNNGSCSGTSCPIYTAAGKYGGAYTFDGVNDYLDCGNDSSLNIVDALTIEAWVKPLTFGDRQGIVGRTTYLSAYSFVIHSSSGELSFYNGNGTNHEDFYSSSLSLNVFQHIAVVRDSTAKTISFYINGELQGTPANYTLTPTINYNTVQISKSGWGSQYFNGSIDEVRIYSRALPADEIWMHYQSEFMKYNSTEHRFYCNLTDLYDGGYNHFPWANDTAGGSTTGETRVVTVDTPPTTPTLVSPTNAYHTNDNSTTFDWSDSIDYPSIDKYNLIIANDTAFSATNITQNITSISPSNYTLITELPDGIYYWRVRVNNTNGLNSAWSANWSVTIDTVSPIQSVTRPSDSMAYNRFLRNITFEGVCTDTNPYIFNLTFSNSSGSLIYSIQNMTVVGGNTLTLDGDIDISSLADGNYTLNWSCSDSHTGLDLSDLKKGKKGETVLLVNTSDDGIQYKMDLFFVEKDDKSTDTPGDTKTYLEYNEANTKINFGVNFTVLKPETKIVFNISVNGTDLKYLNDSGFLGHIIWYPYGTDFDGALTVNGVEKTYQAVVTTYSDYILVKIQPDVNLAGNDEVVLVFDSIFGLNIVSQEDVVYLDSVNPSLAFVSPASGYINVNYTYVNITVTDTHNTSAIIDFNRSLVGWWSMDYSNSTHMYDNSSYSNHGEFKGAGFGEGSLGDGKYGQGLDFDGVNDYIDCGNDGSLNITDGDFALECWVKTSTVGTDQVIMARRATGNYWLFRINLVNKLIIYLDDGSLSWLSSNTPNLVNDGNWHHVILSRTGSTITFYIDGVSDGGGTSSKDCTNNNILQIGGYGGAPTYPFNGSIDEVRIHNRALSPQEINASFNNGAWRLENNFTDQADGNYSIQGWAIDSAGNINSSGEQWVFVDTTPPTCTRTQTPSDLNFSHWGANITTKWNCSDVSGINTSSFFTGHSLCHNGDCENWSVRAPANALATRLVYRACNRFNKTTHPLLAQWYEYLGLPLLSDICSYAVHDVQSAKVSVDASGPTWANFTYTSLFEHLLHSEWDLHRVKLQAENKTNKYSLIYENNIAAKKFTHGSQEANATYSCHLYLSDQNSNKYTTVYYCNSSLISRHELKPWTKDYCKFIAAFKDVVYNYSVRNSSYMNRIQFSLNESGYLNGIKADPEYYILVVKVDETQPAKADKWHYANGTNITGDGLGFNNINRSYYSTDRGGTWVVANYSFDITCRYAHENKEAVKQFIYVCDNQSNCYTSTLVSDTLGLFLNSPPYIHVTAPTENEIVSGSYNITWDASDPDGDSMNYTGHLCYTNGSINSTLFTEITDKNYTWDTTTVVDGVWRLKVTAKDQYGLNGSELTFNFTVDNTAPTLTYHDPTELNDTTISQNHTVINMSITELNPDTIRFNLSGPRNISLEFFGDSLRLGLGFNNYSAIGENSTRFVDISKYGNHGTCSGTTCPTYTAAGKYGGAYTFDGVNDFITCGNDSSLNITDAISIEAWIKASSNTGASDWRHIAGKREGDIYGLYTEQNGLGVYMNLKVNGSYTYLKIMDVIVGDWQYVAMTFNSSLASNEIKVYSNGNFVRQITAAGTIDSSSASVEISSSVRPFNGSIDNVFIHNRALPADEILMRYWLGLSQHNDSEYRLEGNISNLTDGTWTHYGGANDTAGNSGASEKRVFHVDTQAPTVNLISPSDNNWTLDNPINFTFNYTDAAATANCKLYIDGILADTNATTINNTNTLLQGTGIAEGNHTWQVNCTDTAANEGASSILNIYVDRTKPSITLNSPANGNITSVSQPPFNFTVVDMDSNLSCELFIDGVGYGTSPALNNTPTVITANSTVPDGLHWWNITCSDELQSNTSETRNITVDTQTPSVHIMSPPDNNWTNATSINFIFNVTDNSATLFCRLFIDDVLADVNGTTLNNTPTTLTASPAEGNLTWYVNCTDGAANTGQSTPQNIYVDRTKPRIVLNAPPNNDVTTNVTPTFNFTATDLDTILNCELFIDNIGYGATTANNNTPTTITANDSLTYTQHTWYVNCSDELFTNKSLERNITISANVSVDVGWNLLSLYANDSYDSETLCQAVSGCTVVSKFENQGYISHIKGLPFNIFNIAPGYGFFLHSTQAPVIPLSGSRITTPTKNITISLEKGWNIIAWTSATNTTAEAVCDDVPANYLAKYSSITGFTTHMKDNPSNNFTVSEGKGYFLYSNQTRNWTHN